MSSAAAGCGRISVELHGEDAVFSQLAAAYPLKLLSPRIRQPGLAIAYIINYGGGLVSGDYVSLSAEVGPCASLLLLSQGSTKVFKFRPGRRAASIDRIALKVTTQQMDFVVASGSALFLLPDPVTCFHAASYNQIQTFSLTQEASLVLLDWITSGRKSRGEEWLFSRYYSVNEIMVEGKRVAKDVMLLENEDAAQATLPVRTLADRLAPYSCYATLFLYGPQVQGVIGALKEVYGQISVLKSREPAELLWSLSALSDSGAVVRVAGKETEEVRRWLGEMLRPLEVVLGKDVFRQAFQSGHITTK
ncbi:UreD urease accessory protein-domain-containing protein [Mycena pura]|uniref:UreD urease accessory protein-domain-containing protein n=1 Tax=Mycena pura TaxID=153505 RepID=A0AAD6YQ30_9AGAR|nr:UreD urease accessory protein-domain-containing protein [Mycena pura]